MFGKKKEQAWFNAVDDSRSIVHDFRLRHFFESYRTVEYRLYHKLEESEMIPRLEEHLTKLLAGTVDDANGDMLDAIIFGAAREAIPDLARQRYNHLDMLRRLILRHKSDCEDIRMIKQAREHEYESIKAGYDKTCRMLAKEHKEVYYE